MATASPLTPRTHLASHWVSWGQTRPQTAGRALSPCSRRAAAGRSSFDRASSTSGMETPTGQPSTHGRCLHWMHRLASCTAASSSSPRFTSAKFRLRTVASSSGMWTRLMARRSFIVRSLAIGNLLEETAVAGGVVRLRFEAAVSGQTVGQTGKVDLVAVEFGAVDAGETGLAAYYDPAAAAHAGAVDHDRVEADQGLDAVGAGKFRHCPHHRYRTDGQHQPGTPGRIGDQVGQFGGNESLPSLAAVFRGHQELL